MLGILSKIGKKRNLSEKSSAVTEPEIDREGLMQLIPHFPIGNAVKYFPEYKPTLTLTTTIIAYGINNELVYSNSDISWQQNGDATQLYLHGEPVEKLRRFCFIVPTASRDEEGLDYTRKAQLGRSGGFIKGNNITLKGEQRDGRLPVLEAVVRRQLQLKEGHYDGHQVAILDVDPAEFKLIDQRSQVRLQTDIPGMIQARYHKEMTECTMVDFSDRAARIIYEAEQPLQRYREGAMVTFTFGLPEEDAPKVIRGRVIRKHDATVVMSLDDIMREKMFDKVEPFDIMEIKANLLQYNA